jgi:hypothetical protein
MKTIVPRVANAKLSCRLVPNMSPDDIAAKVKAHLESKGAELLANVTVKVSGFRSYPWTSPRDTPGGDIYSWSSVAGLQAGISPECTTILIVQGQSPAV